MAKLIVTIPDAWVARILAAFCKNYGYQAMVVNPDSETGELMQNPESILQFTIRQRINFLKDNLKKAEVPDLARTDRAARIAEIDAVEITMEPYIEPE